nr:MAG TPA: hypothetical protein [Caudoviricetes sp.]
MLLASAHSPHEEEPPQSDALETLLIVPQSHLQIHLTGRIFPSRCKTVHFPNRLPERSRIF